MDPLPRVSYSGPPRSVSISDPEGITKKGRRVTLSAISNIFPHLERTSRCTGSSIDSIRVPSQWEILMRKFSEDRKRQDMQCKYKGNLSGDLQCEWRKNKTFATGSTYDGTWDEFGLCGYGRYTFPNGVVYEGEFEDSNFHGEGELQYPDGIVVRGRWHHGEIVEKNIIFSDGVCYKEKDWDYCQSPDRRYSREYKGIVGAGQSNLTIEQPSKTLPEGTYDTGDGAYDPKFNAVYAHDNPNHFIRTPDAQAVKWISENCRFSPDRTMGPCPHLYGKWLKPSLTLPETPPAPTCYSVKESIIYETDSCNRFFPWATSAHTSKKSVSAESVRPADHNAYKAEPGSSKESAVQNPHLLSGNFSRRYKPTHARISEEIEL